jgi:hypothetical protein
VEPTNSYQRRDPYGCNYSNKCITRIIHRIQTKTLHQNDDSWHTFVNFSFFIVSMCMERWQTKLEL